MMAFRIRVRDSTEGFQGEKSSTRDNFDWNQRIIFGENKELEMKYYKLKLVGS